MHRPVSKHSLLLLFFTLAPCLLATGGRRPGGDPHPLLEARKDPIDPFDVMLTDSDQKLYGEELECVKKNLKVIKPPIPKPKPKDRYIKWDMPKFYFTEAIDACGGVVMQKFVNFLQWNGLQTRMSYHEIHDSLVAHWPMKELFSDEMRESYTEQSEALGKCEDDKGCKSKNSGHDWVECCIACNKEVRVASSYDADSVIESFFFKVLDSDPAQSKDPGGRQKVIDTWLAESEEACRRYNKAQGLDEDRCSEEHPPENL